MIKNMATGMNKGKWMMMVIGLSFIICHLSFSSIAAQTFLDRLQTNAAGQGTITVQQDTAISNLVLDPHSTVKPEDRKPTPTTPSTTNTTQNPPRANASRTDSTTTTTPVTTPQNNRVRRTVNGYRIQAFAGGNSREDRKKAERTANDIRAQLPNVAVSAHFYPPRWICYVGNYRTMEEANQMLRTIKGLGYSQALVVRAKITVYQ
jgi:cytoskeletal protein RodZ